MQEIPPGGISGPHRVHPNPNEDPRPPESSSASDLATVADAQIRLLRSLARLVVAALRSDQQGGRKASPS
jgi:hypothetical protein